MPKFSAKSLKNLNEAHPLLIKLFTEVIKDTDCTVLDGQRGKADQEKAFALGHSKAHFGQSPHNFKPAVALDVVPYPLDWEDTAAFKALSDVVLAKAKSMGIQITWGGDWRTIKDMPHYELENWRDLVAAGKVKLL